MFNIRSVDLNLLPVFEAVYEEQSLSRAAKRLAMTQSAVSHAVTRLRSVFHDELFVRHSRGVVPTSGADIVYPKVRGALGAVRDAVTELRGFDPRTSTRDFSLTIPHPLGPMIMLSLSEHLGRTAPGIKVAASTRSRPIDLHRALREGLVDAAIDWVAPRGDEFNTSTLFDDSLMIVVRKGHPALGHRPSMKVLRAGRFVALRPRAEAALQFSEFREWQRLNLNIVLEVSEILEVFMVASRSDLFGLIPRSMEKIARNTLGLRPLGIPVRMSKVPILLVWHASREADPAHIFLRKEIAATAVKMVREGV
jgi:DNA-binding transcriptional LysR family regulator